MTNARTVKPVTIDVIRFALESARTPGDRAIALAAAEGSPTARRILLERWEETGSVDGEFYSVTWPWCWSWGFWPSDW